MKNKILITGGTGMVGSHLTALLRSKGHEVVLLSRKAGVHNGLQLYKWDPIEGTIDENAFEGVTKIVHLAGTGIADARWTKAYKQQIFNSRNLSTQLLVDTICHLHVKPQVLVSTSATGIYGNRLEGVADEQTKHGQDFLANVCEGWEQALTPLYTIPIRTVILRLGVVFANSGGFIPKVSKPIKWGVGAALGNGQQLLSWIHLADVCRLYEQALINGSMEGVYNAVAPEPVSNLEITRKMAEQLKRPLFLPNIPEWVLRILLGEVTDSLLASLPVKPARLNAIGFDYLFPTLDGALDDLL